VNCWMPRGRQLAVKTPGKNRKLAAFGALGYQPVAKPRLSTGMREGGR
jgi:hypothetical protein